MVVAIYFLCALTSFFCAFLLLRTYFRSPNQLLFWSAICFVCLALANILLVVDLVIFPQVSLAVYRSAITLLGLGALLYGLIKETN